MQFAFRSRLFNFVFEALEPEELPAGLEYVHLGSADLSPAPVPEIEWDDDETEDRFGFSPVRRGDGQRR